MARSSSTWRQGSEPAARSRLTHTFTTDYSAARAFNRDGFDGTDSNRIAREAGYAPGTFYKHFADMDDDRG